MPPKKTKASAPPKPSIKRLSMSAIQRSPWLEHVDETIRKNPGEKLYKNILKKASITYRQG